MLGKSCRIGDQLYSALPPSPGLSLIHIYMYINGYFEGSVNFEHPSETPVVFSAVEDSDGFISKYAPDGKLVWARIFRNGDYGGVYEMSLHRNSHLYFAGNYTLLSDLDPVSYTHLNERRRTVLS